MRLRTWRGSGADKIGQPSGEIILAQGTRLLQSVPRPVGILSRDGRDGLLQPLLGGPLDAPEQFQFQATTPAKRRILIIARAAIRTAIHDDTPLLRIQDSR